MQYDNETSNLIKQGQDFMQVIKGGNFQHISIDISGKIMAPILLIPENPLREDSPCLVVDAGWLAISSKLNKFEKDKNYKEETDPKKLFDEYSIDLQQASVYIQQVPLQEKHKSVVLMDEFSTSICVLACLDPQHSELVPAVEVDVLFGEVKVDMST